MTSRHEHEREDALIDLASKLLDPAESARILVELRACGECESRFREICGRIESLRAQDPPEALREAFEAPPRGAADPVEDAAPSRPADLATRRRGRRVATIVGVAAAAGLVIAASLVLLRSTAGDRLDYWLPLEERLGSRSGGPAEDLELERALDAYRRHDTRRVAEILESRVLSESQDPMKIVLASALVWEGRHAEARRVLEGIGIETLPLPDRDRALWILMTALERSGDHEGAHRILQRLASSDGELSGRARSALEALASP